MVQGDLNSAGIDDVPRTNARGHIRLPTEYPALAKPARAIILLTALAVLVPAVAACLKWEHYSHAPSNIFCLLFFILPGLSATLAVIGVRCRPCLRLRVAVFLVAAGLGAFATELLLGVHTLNAERPESAAEYVVRSRADGQSVFPYLAPTNFLDEGADGEFRSRLTFDGREVLPVAGRSFTQQCPCNESGTPLVYTSDRFGLHNPDVVWDEPQLDIAVVGDSFAHGWCVASNDNFASQIRKRYSKTVNLGSAGNGPLLNLASIREYLPDRKPKLVIWYHFEGNDFLDLAKEANSPLLRKYLRDDFTQNLMQAQSEIDGFIENEIEVGLQSALDRKKVGAGERIKRFMKLSRIRQTLSLSFGYSLEYDLDDFGKAILAAKRDVENWGGQLHFVYLPWQDRYQRMASTDNYDQIKADVLRCVTNLGVRVTDCDAAFLKTKTPLRMFTSRDGGHYTARGNRVVAETTLSDIATYYPRIFAMDVD